VIECRSKRNFSLPRQASTSGTEKASSRSSNRDHPKLKQKGTQTETYDELFMSDDSMTSNEDTGTSKQSSNTLFSSNTLIDNNNNNNSDDWAYDSVKANAGSNTLEHITASSRANRPSAYKKPPKRRKSLPSQCSTNDEPHTVTLIPRGPLICSNLENLESWLPDRLFASSVSSSSALLKENSGCSAPPNAPNTNSILINDNSKANNEPFSTSIDMRSEGACKRGMNSNSASISLNSNSDSSNANNAEVYSSSNSTASSVTAGCADSGEKSSIASLPVQNCATAIKILTDLSELDAAGKNREKNKTQSLSSSKFMSIKPPRLVITNTNTNTTISSSLCSNPFVIEENVCASGDKSGSESYYRNKTNNINIAGYTGLNYNSSRYSQTSNLGGSGSMVGSANNRSRFSKISNLKKNSSSTSTSTTSLAAKPVEASFKQAKLESSVDKKIPISMNRNRIESDCDLNFIIEAGQNDHLNESSNDEDNDVFIKYKLKEAEQVFFVFDYFWKGIFLYLDKKCSNFVVEFSENVFFIL
jgi:hypothetical protein